MKKGLCLALCLLLSVCWLLPTAAEEIDPSYTQLDILMTVERLDGGQIKATMIDSTGGAVAAWPVYLLVNGETVDTQYSSYMGEAIFDYIVEDETAEIACTAYSGYYDTYYFAGSTVKLNEAQVTLTTLATTTTTDTSTQDMVSEQFSMSYAPITTAVRNDQIGVGVDFDDGTINVMQRSIEDLNERSRMWISKENYDAMVLEDTATVHLKVELNSEAATQEQLIAAKNADSTYAAYSDTQVKGFAMDLSVEYLDGTQYLQITPPDGMYQIELPVPDSMKACEKLAVAVCTSDGLAQLVEVKQSGGVIDFTLQKFQTLALVGFYGNSTTVNTLAQTPSLLIVLCVVGALLIVGAVLLIVLVVLRRRKSSESAARGESGALLISPLVDKPFDPPVTVEQQREEVLMDADAQTTLSEEEREHFRAKAPVDAQALEKLQEKSVPPTQQIDATDAQPIILEEPVAPLTVDDLLAEFYDEDKKE